MIDLIRLSLSDWLGLPHETGTPEEHLDLAMRWLCRAQDAAQGGGVARGYTLKYQSTYKKSGWLPPYPETTGYIIETFYDFAARAGQASYRDRAQRMAKWESEVQMESGAVQGAVLGFEQTPAIFNTGQVCFGWARAYEETKDETFLRSAQRAGDFLVHALDEDGAWRRHGSQYARSGVNVYDTRTAYGLARAWQVTKDAAHRDGASRNLAFAITRLRPNGWIEECCLTDNDHPLLHTLAYAAEGWIGGGAILEDSRFLEAGKRVADALLAKQRPDGGLAGRFDPSWNEAASWSCLTGDAQTSICWWRLFEITGEERYREAGRALNRYLMRTQRREDPNPAVVGAIKGSHPLWGGYGPFEYLNWAAKFFADALLLETRLDKKS
jgi:hypothetical protein